MIIRCGRIVVALLLIIVPSGALVQARSGSGQNMALRDQLRQHMAVLASDDFGGRQPGTEGETRTLDYIARQWAAMGLVSGTNDPGHPWLAPVIILVRSPDLSAAEFMRGGRPLPLPPGNVLVLTSGRRSLIGQAPLYFVGHGPFGTGAAPVPPRAELAGRIAVVLDRQADGAPTTKWIMENSDRQDALLAGGASAVLTVLDGQRSLADVTTWRMRPGYALADKPLGGDLEAFISATGFEHLLAANGQSLAGLEHEADQADFTPHPLNLSANLEATTRETTIQTHNLIARLPGKDAQAGAVLVLAHWDHFGTCAQVPAQHLICNGAIDNASGVAALIEIARRLAKGPPLDRDVYFIATTSEEQGLLGAEALAENPPLPLRQVVAAFNLDSVAIAPAGAPMGIVGRGMTPLDPGIAQVAREQHRTLILSDMPNDYLRRQDGWALMRHDVPAVMVTSAYGDMGRLRHFFDTDYHRPGDVMKPGIEYGGAADDVLFNVALVQFFADSHKFPK